MKKVLHIVPATPPAFNGLGDYTQMLHRHWPEPRPEWHVAALRVTEGAEAIWPGVRFRSFERNAESLAETLVTADCETVALQYVPHGYHPKGVPLWMPEGLCQWKDASGGQLITFFHEVFAYGPPWRSSFWLMPGAVRALRRIVNLSDVILTSNDAYARFLRRFGGYRGNIDVLPVGSNLPLLGHAPEFRSSPWRIAVFGAPGTRRAALEMHRSLLNALGSERMLATMVLIGANGSHEEVAEAETFAPVETHFDATGEEASRAIASCDFGVTASVPHIMSKSGVYAAYCAHGLPTLVNGRSSIENPYIGTRGRSPSDVLNEMRNETARSALRHRVESYASISSWPNIAQRWSEKVDLCVANIH